MTDIQQEELKKINEERESRGEQHLTELPQPAPSQAEITDDFLIAELNKRTGKEYKSFEDLTPKPTPTEQEIEKQKEERKTKRAAWALETGVVTEKRLTEFMQVSGNPERLIYNDFLATKKAEDADVDEKDVEQEFEEITSKLGASKIKELAEAILEKKYPDVFSIENKYSQYEEGEKTVAEASKKLKSESPLFINENNSIIDKYVSEGIEYEIPFGTDGSTVKVKIDLSKENADKIRNHFNSDANVRSSVLNGYDKEKNAAIIKNSLATIDINGLVKQVYEQAQLDKEALNRGIPPINGKFERDALKLDGKEEQYKANEEVFKSVFAKKPEGALN